MGYGILFSTWHIKKDCSLRFLRLPDVEDNEFDSLIYSSIVYAQLVSMLNIYNNFNQYWRSVM